MFDDTYSGGLEPDNGSFVVMSGFEDSPEASDFTSHPHHFDHNPTIYHGNNDATITPRNMYWNDDGETLNTYSQYDVEWKDSFANKSNGSNTPRVYLADPHQFNENSSYFDNPNPSNDNMMILNAANENSSQNSAFASDSLQNGSGSASSAHINHLGQYHQRVDVPTKFTEYGIENPNSATFVADNLNKRNRDQVGTMLENGIEMNNKIVSSMNTIGSMNTLGSEPESPSAMPVVPLAKSKQRQTNSPSKKAYQAVNSSAASSSTSSPNDNQIDVSTNTTTNTATGMVYPAAASLPPPAKPVSKKRPRSESLSSSFEASIADLPSFATDKSQSNGSKSVSSKAAVKAAPAAKKQATQGAPKLTSAANKRNTKNSNASANYSPQTPGSMEMSSSVSGVTPTDFSAPNSLVYPPNSPLQPTSSGLPNAQNVVNPQLRNDFPLPHGGMMGPNAQYYPYPTTPSGTHMVPNESQKITSGNLSGNRYFRGGQQAPPNVGVSSPSLNAPLNIQPSSPHTAAQNPNNLQQIPMNNVSLVNPSLIPQHSPSPVLQNSIPNIRQQSPPQVPLEDIANGLDRLLNENSTLIHWIGGNLASGKASENIDIMFKFKSNVLEMLKLCDQAPSANGIMLPPLPLNPSLKAKHSLNSAFSIELIGSRSSSPESNQPQSLKHPLQHQAALPLHPSQQQPQQQQRHQRVAHFPIQSGIGGPTNGSYYQNGQPFVAPQSQYPGYMDQFTAASPNGIVSNTNNPRYSESPMSQNQISTHPMHNNPGIPYNNNNNGNNMEKMNGWKPTTPSGPFPHPLDQSYVNSVQPRA